MGIILPFLYTSLCLLALSSIVNIKLLKLLPISIVVSILIFYVLCIFLNIDYAFLILNIIIFIFFIYFLYKLFLKKDKDLLKIIKDKDNLWIMILYVFVIFINFNKGFNGWDDYSHWGVMVKESLRLNKLYSVNESMLTIHKDYPPLQTLYQIIWVKLCNGYSEAYLLRASLFLSLSFLVSFIEKNKLINIVIVLITSCFFKEISFLMYQTIYTDPILAISIAYCIIILVNEKNNIIKIISLIFLIMIKQIGFVFFVLCLAIYFFNKLLNKNKINISDILLVVLPCIFYKSWGIYISQFLMPKQFEVGLKEIVNFYKVFYLPKDTWQYISATNYLNSVFHRNIFLNFSYITSLLIISILIFILYIKDRKKSILLAGFYIIGGIGYGLLMLILYTTSFGPFEGVILASFERYLTTYLFVGIILIMFELFNMDFKYKVVYIILGIFISSSNLINLKPQLVYNSWGNYLYNDVVKIKNGVENDRGVYLISNNDNGSIPTIVRYYLNPMIVHSFNEGISLEEFKNNILSVGYIYIIRYDSYLYENYLYPAMKIDYFEEGALYKIEGSIDDIVASKVNYE